MSFVSKIGGAISEIRNKINPNRNVVSPRATATQSFMHDFIAPHDAFEIAQDPIEDINENLQDNLFGDENTTKSQNKLFFIA